MLRWMRRAALAASAVFVALGGVLVLPASSVGAAEGDGSGVSVARYGGADRYATSLLVAEAFAAEAGGSLESVVLVSGERWTDAVVAAPMAGALGAPVLMTPHSALRSDAVAFFKSTGVSRAVVVGPDGSGGAHGPGRGVSAGVLAELAESGIAVQRVAGPNLYRTGVAAAEQVTPGVMPGLGRTAIIASGEVFADALVAGPFAARGSHPVLLTPPGELHADVAAYLSAASIEHAVIMGGTAALSDTVESSVKALGVSVTRLAGATRYDTAVKAAELVSGRYSDTAGKACFADSTVGLARARVPFDSFSAAPLLSRLCAPLVLADPGRVPDDTAAFVDAARAAHATVDLRVFGGDAAVSQAAINSYLAGGEDIDEMSQPEEDEAEPVGLPAGTCGGSNDDKPRKLIDSNAAEDPTWSPDCSQIVFSKFRALWIANNDGSDMRQLVPDEGAYLHHPAWSPDGTSIAYVRGYRNDDGHWVSHIWSADVGGSDRTKLTSGSLEDRWPRWSPDGTRIAFERTVGSERNPDGSYLNADRYVVTMDPDGRNTKVLNAGGWPEEAPAWSPDGQLLAFTSNGAVEIAEVDGSKRHAIIAGGYWNGGLSFSPDGRRIAFVRGDQTRSAIYVANLDGTDERVIFDEDVQAIAPRWSPDGQRLLFHIVDDENRFQIFVSGANGKSVPESAAKCRPRGVDSDNGTAGFPLHSDVAPATGTLRVAVLFMDFPDAQATHTTHEEAAFGLSYVEQYLEAASYGRLNVELVPHHTWLRAEHSYTRYSAEITLVETTAIIWPASVHAISLADDEMDFSDIDVVLTVFPSSHFDSGNAHGTTVADGATLKLARVGTAKRSQPAELFFWGFNAAHEVTHTLGLLDLYPYDAGRHDTTDAIPHGKTRVDAWWGLMLMRSWFIADSTDPRLQHTWRHTSGLTEAGYDHGLDIPEMLAWSRWQLGWLEESQVRCVNDSNATVMLAPVAQPGDDTAMAAVPLSNHELIVIESRRTLGYDVGRSFTAPDGWSTKYPALITEGVLVYTVDTLVGTGELPIKIAGDTGDGEVDDFPVLQVGESVTVHGYTITVTADGGDTHTVEIRRNS